MTDKKKNIIFVLIIVSVVLFVFFYWYNNEVSNKWYVKYEGKYYGVIGAVTYEEGVQEFVGEVKRITPRTLWNRDGDSNFSFEGARIGIVSDGDYAVETIAYLADTGETRSEFWMMVDPKE